jgi:predicted RND superfamily exporter protein
LDYVTQTDEQRDRIVNSLGDAIQVQTAQRASRIAQKDAMEAVKKVTDVSGQQDAVANEVEVLRRKVGTAKSSSAGFTEKLRPLTVLLVTLVVTVLLYFTVGWFLPYGVMMFLAFAVVAAGFGGAIYFSVKT